MIQFKDLCEADKNPIDIDWVIEKKSDKEESK